MHGDPVDAQALLAHGEFVRALARKLVFDDDRVDDVVQDTWVAALEHAPERPRSLKAWLARVAKNVAIKTLRADSRRRRRDEQAPEPRPPEPPPDAVDRLARGRQVVDAVLALDEPYRTTVVLRFYEDLEPKEIARRLGLNDATVRTRLKRGLGMLRARLDRDAGGRRAWCLALLPVLVPDRSITGGVLLMSAKTKLSIAAVLVLAAFLVTWGSLTTGHRQQRASTAPAAPPAAGSEGVPGTETVAEAAAGSVRVVVRVEDESGQALPGSLVEAHPSWSMDAMSFSGEDAFFAGAIPVRPVATATTDATGVAVFRHEPRLALVYRAMKEGYAKADSGRIELRDRGPDPVTLTLGPACPLTGFVFDEDGRAVAHAPVLAADPGYGATAPDHQIPLRTVTGDDGSYRFDNLPPRAVAVWAAFPGGVPWRVATLRFPRLQSFDIVLERGGTVLGTVTDGDGGEPVAGARVRVMGYFQHRAEVTTDAQGRFEVRSLPATMLSTIRLQKEGWYQLMEPGARDQIGVRLTRGDSMRVDLRMRRGPVLRGTVRGPDGPLALGTLQASNWWTPGGGYFKTRTDDEGRYALAVAPGRHVVLIGSRNLTIPGALDWSVRPENAKGDEANVVDMPERGEVVRDFTLEPDERSIEVRGRVVERGGRPIEGAQVGDVLSAADGSFEARGWKGHPMWASKIGFSLGKSEDPVEPGRDVEIVLDRAPLLSGSVAARDGSAVDGAFVLVAREPQSSDSGDRARLYDRLWLDATRIPAPKGRYEFRHIEPGRYFLRAGGGRHALSAPATVVLEPAQTRTHDFTLDLGEPIRGRIVDAGTGAPVRGAWVHCDPLDAALRNPEKDALTGRSLEGQVVAAVSDDAGMFVIDGLSRGEYEIAAEARGFLDATARATTGGGQATLALERALEIRGVATFRDGQPAAGLTVIAHRDGDVKDRFYAPSTGPDGRLVVPKLRRGTYRVTVGGNGAQSATSGPVDTGTSDLKLVVERAQPGDPDAYPQPQEGDATLEGTVVDPAGKGLMGAQVFASPMSEHKDLLGRSTRSGADGRFVIRGVKAEAHRVRAIIDAGLWQMKEDVVPGRDAPAFVFASIAGVITGADVEGRELVAAPHPYDKEKGIRIATVLAGGRFEITGLPPGRYDVCLKPPKDRPHLLLEGGDALEAGQRDLVLRATKGASIAGVVVDDAGRPIEGAGVAARRDESREWSSLRTAQDGRFELSGLRAGVTYDLSVSVPGKVRTRMRVEAPTSGLRIAIETGFAASGRLVGADGKPVANTQLRFVAQGHEAPEAHAVTDADGRFAVDGLRDGEYRVETWPKVVLKVGDPWPEWQPVGTIRARDKDVEIRMK